MCTTESSVDVHPETCLRIAFVKRYIVLNMEFRDVEVFVWVSRCRQRHCGLNRQGEGCICNRPAHFSRLILWVSF